MTCAGGSTYADESPRNRYIITLKLMFPLELRKKSALRLQWLRLPTSSARAGAAAVKLQVPI